MHRKKQMHKYSRDINVPRVQRRSCLTFRLQTDAAFSVYMKNRAFGEDLNDLLSEGKTRRKKTIIKETLKSIASKREGHR